MSGIRSVLTGSAALWLAASPSVQSALPALDERPWIGHFIGYEDRKFRFGLTMQGKGSIVPMKDRNKPFNDRTCPTFEIAVQELVPGRDPVLKRIQPNSLETADPPTTKLEKTSFRGKVTGDASFEVFIENNRGDFTIGGRVLDPGKIKNPLRFTIQVKFPNAYPYGKKNKAFEKRVSKDRVTVERTDGKRIKLAADEKNALETGESHEPGIRKAHVDFDAHDGAAFEFSASGASLLKLIGTEGSPLYEGFTVQWIPDPAKDPEAKDRLHLTVE